MGETTLVASEISLIANDHSGVDRFAPELYEGELPTVSRRQGTRASDQSISYI